jgi:hypothetical protein
MKLLELNILTRTLTLAAYALAVVDINYSLLLASLNAMKQSLGEDWPS